MALGDAYAAVADLEARTGVSDPGNYADLLDAASRAVEQFTHRQYNTDESATARSFRAADPWRLPVDDFSTLTGLVVATSGTNWDAANYQARPANGVVDGVSGWPFFDLIAVNRTWPYKRHADISVTAQWGWAAVPEAIKQTTLNIAAQLATGGSSGGSGAVKSESIDGYSVSYADEEGVSQSALVALSTFSLAEPYRRKRFGVA